MSLPGAPHVLFAGYNGAENTGAEARLLAIIDDVRAVLGTEVVITIPTLNETALRRYVRESPGLRIERVPALFPAAVRRLVRAHDAVLLVEGSTYMDTWTQALLWFFLWTTRCAHAAGKPVMAYAVDAGHLSRANRVHVRREASKTGLISLRSYAAAKRLSDAGVTARIEVTADPAFLFEPSNMPPRRPVVGFAPVDFWLWPVVIRPWAPRSRCYRWPYYFSSSRERGHASRAHAAALAAEADRIVSLYNRDVALIAMEALDEPMVRNVLARMRHGSRARVYSAREHSASEMTALLRSLELLVTSRYHAAVLSMPASVAQIAIGHDFRIADLYVEVGLGQRWFFPHEDNDLWLRVRAAVDSLIASPDEQTPVLHSGCARQTARAHRNRDLLRSFFA